MSFRTSISLSALAVALVANPSFADVTAEQVWADWKSYMEGFGYATTGTETRSGDTLTVSDLVMTYTLPEDEGTVSVTLGTIGFTDTGSGSVTVVMPDTMPVGFDMTPNNGDAAKGVVLFKQNAPAMVVTGDDNDLTYTYSAASIGMTLDSLTADGQDLPAEMFDVSMTIADVSNTTRMKIGDLRDYTQTMTTGAVNYTMNIDIPDGPDAGKVSLLGTTAGMNFSGQGTIPMTVDATDMDAMLKAGFAFAGGFDYAGGSMSIDAVTPDGPFKASTSSDSGAAKVAMGSGGLDYDVSQTNLKISAQQIPEFPFPVDIDMARSAFKFLMPLQASDAEQDFAFGITLGDFSISDVIWNLFDPAEQLPRDPATIALDLTGKAKILLNFMDPEQAAQLETGAVPGELNALNINSVLVSAVGAELTGDGAFTFDNSDTVTFGGMPKPAGALDVRLSGANALMDTLVSMGLLPEEQAMGARMMMGLFGVPQGDDVLTSKIEVNDEGHVLANGQRLR